MTFAPSRFLRTQELSSAVTSKFDSAVCSTLLDGRLRSGEALGVFEDNE